MLGSKQVVVMREISNNRIVATVRILAGVIVLSTGVMKYAVPMLWEAWSRQLIAADLPLYSLALWTVPAVEIVLGIALVLGICPRLAAMAVSGLMVVATYVHLTVRDPTVFPLQPHFPIAPLMVLAMALVVVAKGAGAFRKESVHAIRQPIPRR